MNLGKFQQKFRDSGLNHGDALEIIEELERALDAKNIQIAAKKPVVKLSQKYLDQIKRYKDYGIE